MKGSMLPHPESLALNIFSQNLSLVIKHHGFKFRFYNFIIKNYLETDLRKHSLVFERLGHMAHAHMHLFRVNSILYQLIDITIPTYLYGYKCESLFFVKERYILVF